MTTLAGNLAYVSLLSLVPLIAVVFALFAAFPMFSDVSVQLRHFIFANFIPATGDVIQRYIEQFVANSNKMTAVGACGLIVTALLLMYAIDNALNTIWRSKRTRPKVYSFAVYSMKTLAGERVAELKTRGYENAGLYDPAGVGGTHVMYVLHHADKPNLYHGLPENPEISATVKFWKGIWKPLAAVGFAATFAASIFHYVGVGPNRAEEEEDNLHEEKDEVRK